MTETTTPKVPASQYVQPLDKREGGVTMRVVLLSLFLAVFFGYLIPIIDLKLSNSFLGAQHLPPGAVGVLLLLLAVNPLLRLFGRRCQFSRNEMLTVYITCLFSCLVPGHGAENFIITNIIGPYYFASPENNWLLSWQHSLPSWLTPALTSDGAYAGAHKAAVEGWYMGTNGQVPWGVWLVPLFAWGAFIMAIYVMLGCLSVILRAQWGDREALSFPLLRLPLELTADTEQPRPGGENFFRNNIMWIGFGIAVFVQLLNGLNGYNADIPKIQMGVETGPLFSEAPWNQIGWTPIVIWPIVIGITYLLTTEVAFSMWFFYLFIKFQFVVAYYMGQMPNSMPGALGADGKIFTSYQRVGATLAYVFFTLWIGRMHWKYVALRALGLIKITPEERREAVSYPVAFWGFVLAFLFIIGFSILSGMSLWLALSLWGTYLIIAIALARVIAEAGILFVQQGWTPIGWMAQMTGSGTGTWLSASTGLAPGLLMQSAFINDMRGFSMPSFLQGLKLAHDRGIRARPLWTLVWAVILVTLVTSFYMYVRIGYDSGGLQCNAWVAKNGPQEPAKQLASLTNGAQNASSLNALWMLLGGGITLALMWARSMIPGFPLHPIGFLMCQSYPAHQMWFSIFLGWLCKVLITRFGGVDTYRKATPAFLGLALGDVSMIIFWLVVDGFTGRIGHTLTPG